jgi:uncharacterized membrane protein YedE/YeeE
MSGMSALLLALAMGFAFGFLLHRGRVTDCNVIENQFRLRDFTVLKVMGTAIVVGGIGVMLLVDAGSAKYYIKDANLLGVALGAALFGVGMVLYGYCPGTGLAAVATGSLHALAGVAGMLLGGILFALSFDWVKAHILTVAALGKVRLPDLTGVPDAAWFAGLAVAAIAGFVVLEVMQRRKA